MRADTTRRRGAVRLAWNANPEPDIAGYVVHWRGADEEYAEGRTVTTADTRADLTLAPGCYYAAVLAYNHTGLRSPLSEEIQVCINSAVEVHDAPAVAPILQEARP